MPVANLTPQDLDVDLTSAGAPGCYADVLRYTGSNRPMWITRHGGAGTLLHRRGIWGSGGSLNLLANHLNSTATTKFDVCSLGTPQFAFTSDPGPVHLQGNTMEVPTSGVVYPDNINSLKAAINAVISIYNPSKVIIGGQSWGNILGLPLMMREALDARIVGYLGYHPIPDLRPVRWSPKADVLSWKVHTGTFGTTTYPAWSAVPLADREALSFCDFVERGDTANYRPCFFVMEHTGDHIMPYGDTLRPNASAHDTHQFLPLISDLLSAGIDFEHHIFDLTGQFTDATYGDPVAVTIGNWMASLL